MATRLTIRIDFDNGQGFGPGKARLLELIAELRIPHLLIVPNEPGRLESLEADGSRRDFAGAITRAGYEPARVEPVIADPAVAELVRVADEFHLFRRTGA